MKKVICVLAISLMVISTCQAKTISWIESEDTNLESKAILIAEDVVETKSVTISDLEHQIQQHQAKSDYELEQKVKKEAELAEIMTALKVTDTDGTLSIEK